MKISNKLKNKKESGQMVLILVLMTIVGVTIGLSLVSRTIQDVRISSQIEQSSRAFSAAEAGVENALKFSNAGSYNGTIDVGGTSSSYQSQVTNIGGGAAGSTLVTFGLTDVNQTQTIWLTDHSPGGDLMESSYYPLGEPIYICWQNGSPTPAAVITLYYKNGSSYYVIKGAYDPVFVRGGSNSFRWGLPEGTGGNCGGVPGYNYQVTITPTTSAGNYQVPGGSILLFAKVQMLYVSSPLAVLSSSTNSFPPQGKQITSVGQTASGVTRRIQVIQGFKTLPSLLDFALYSQ
ncbi:hypothetical protein A3D77_02845 [Candidatus Gottesmanbacteria bacterium RIFCSPHIGHO2_02_FULL_39_11]|uniref:Type 4 fimbrial biogenesis protein PilX N-terminal domain-containing protein n=1 Tax=Candidatus Gottesmanbacteria bacterium RIFCSPHIGHO2_02_FULL_39_11 TaxID=1798382 RepID=A0A1F5ZT27_9BACT|nr:MAG: hypothetical protein A3D77_02845 [Candidatus Gottesmanbacteria bacterium RIFCSPHIGHO2_02_FULL_39_11]